MLGVSVTVVSVAVVSVIVACMPIVCVHRPEHNMVLLQLYI